MNREQSFLLFVILVFGLLSLYVLLPLLEFVLLAVIAAYVLYPINRWLEPHLGRRVAPLVVITAAVLVVVLPILYIILVLYRDLQRLAEAPPDLELSQLQRELEARFGEEFDPEAALQEVGIQLLEILFGDISDLFFTLIFVGFGLTVVFFVVYFLLRDGAAFVGWLVKIAPMNHRVGDRLVHQIDRTTHGVIVGHLFVALLQGVLGGIAFYIVGIPNVVFWAFVMTIMSLLPLIGPFVVWGPWAGYLVFLDQIPGAVFLVVFGLFVIGMVDNYGRPIVIDRDAKLNPAVILIGVFGGIYSIGLTGLFIGPIVLGVFAASLTVFHDEWEHLSD